jgi:antagonist of KipI
MPLEICSPTQMTTIQDRGRIGWQHLGVGPSGPMDWLGARLANLAVGNSQFAPTLEIAGTRARFRLSEDALIASAGRGLLIDGEPAPAYRPIAVRAGSEIRFGEGGAPFHTYFAVAGSFEVPVVLGSASTSTSASFGKLSKRGLGGGEVLKIGQRSKWASDWLELLTAGPRSFPNWHVYGSLSAFHAQNRTQPYAIRVIRDEHGECTNEAWKSFLKSTLTISPQSSRMGYRLQGASLPSRKSEILSRGVVTGTVQLPPDGNPVILMADRQTTGGYPVLGHVAWVDLPVLAAAWPGEKLSFYPISVEEAQARLLAIETALQKLERSLLANQGAKGV